jgi:hypothetical protein
MRNAAQPLRIETTRSGRAQSVVQEARPRSGVVVSYGKCFGREGLRDADERGARLVQSRFSGGRRPRRGCEGCSSGAKRIESARFPLAGDRSPAGVQFARGQVMVVFTGKPAKPAA